jgi:uncharacterized protein (DUF1697 family)
MTVYIALLRGVNVGGKHKLPMKALVSLMEKRGFAGVRSYIQSGNLVFQSNSRPAGTLEALIEQEFGFRPAVFLLTAAELRQALERNPYSPQEGKHLHLFFCDKTPASMDANYLHSLKSPGEEYTLVGKVFYLHAPDGIGRSKLAEKMGKAFPGVNMTARNLNTVKKLAEMASVAFGAAPA